MRIHIINGPNLNMIGIREKHIYGDKSYAALVAYIKEKAKQKGIDVKILQSNYEGRIVTAIQKSRGAFDALIINAAAYTHTSIAILDALKAADLPAVEVHLSNLVLREEFRSFSYVALYTDKTIMGKGFEGYNEALDYLIDRFGNLKTQIIQSGALIKVDIGTVNSNVIEVENGICSDPIASESI